MKQETALPLLVLADVADPIAQPTTTCEEIAQPLGVPARERKRFEVMIETIAACMTNPTIAWKNGPGDVPYEFLHKNRMLIELERMARLMRMIRREDSSLDDIRACATTLTNPEICGVLCVASFAGPPSREVFAEYQRAFAHCFVIEQYHDVFRNDEISVNDLEMFDYSVRPHLKNWSRFDADEREWVEKFNEKLKSNAQ